MNFDGLVGPTFNLGGVAVGNLASTLSAGMASHPRQAALQGLQKMRTLHDLGVTQGVFPPHVRPDFKLAARLGFKGSEAHVLDVMARTAPRLLAACYSSSHMWTANAATVCPSIDSKDTRVHFTPANLQNQLHRSNEPEMTSRILKAIFKSENHFVIHDALPSAATLGDEGAANHTRFSAQYGTAGIHLFVYGQTFSNAFWPKPIQFPARQTREACEAIARLHLIPPSQAVYAQQNPSVIDGGVFHNDVIAVGDQDVFFYHESAYINTELVIDELNKRLSALSGQPLRTIKVRTSELTVDTCVKTYLFNSQLVTLQDGQRALIAPKECEDHPDVHSYLNNSVEDSDIPFDAVIYQDVRQSMHGGGGPACLRLRVELTDQEQAQILPSVIFSEELHEQLKAWVQTHYREELLPKDLADPLLLTEAKQALDELTSILGLGSIYSFQ